VPAYRVVYKTLKTFLPQAEMRWPNLLLRCGHGSIDRGGVRLGGAIPTRREGRWLLPQPGTVTIHGQTMTFHPRDTKNYEFDAWEEVVEDVFFVEMVLQTTTESPYQQIVEGRHRLGHLKTLIELSFGTRVLNAQIAEELGEVFPGDHFNRSIHSQVVGHEWQTDLAVPIRTRCRGAPGPTTPFSRLRQPESAAWSAGRVSRLATRREHVGDGFPPCSPDPAGIQQVDLSFWIRRRASHKGVRPAGLIEYSDAPELSWL